MDADRTIRRLIEEGKIGEAEGRRLLEAYGAAESRDRVLREELRRREAARRGARLGVVLAVAGAAFALGLLIAAAVVVPTLRTPAVETVELAEEVTGQDLDMLIERLEQRLRRPGSAADYKLLAMAYERRYGRSGAETDRLRAAEAWARADRLERGTAMKGSSGIFGAVFVVLVVAGIGVWIMLMYNGLARGDERVNERWAQVEAMLQRRLDLIPSLVDAVRGYAAHERQTLLEVTEARARMLGILQGTGGTPPRSEKTTEELGRAGADLNGAIGHLLALAEQYPDLEASSNFVTLQSQLEGTENRIAVERQRYNDAVRRYNARLRVFPSNVVAGMFGFEPRGYFESSLGAEEPVPTEF